jgi:putative endonuclease
MLNKQQQFGKTAESIAAGQLRKQGYKILAQNYRTSLGEIDIIAREMDVIVFIEVKARNSDRFGNAKQAVTLKKQKKIARVAVSYLKEINQPDARARFDVVAVDAKKKDGNMEIIKNAFDLPYP